mgnify:CR=1 FL=1
MQSALIFILRTLFDLYVLVFVLRLLMQWVRVDTRNPFVQFILRVTNPLVMPLRRLLPPVGRLDSATLMALLGLQMLGTVLITQLACIGKPGVVPILLLTVLGVARLRGAISFSQHAAIRHHAHCRRDFPIHRTVAIEEGNA